MLKSFEKPHPTATTFSKIVNKRRARKIRPPYRHYGPGAKEESFDSGFEKVDVLGAALEATRLEGGPESSETTATGEQDAANLRQHGTSSITTTAGTRLELANENVEAEDMTKVSLNHLPPEILEHVFNCLPRPIPVNLLYVNKLWCSVLLPLIYECPDLNVNNYQRFVATVSGSNDLGNHVRVLDLRNIVQTGKNSFTARILRRCSKGLRVFIAPQTSFGYSPLISLRNCTNLRTLDLSLVSETVDLRVLFLAIANATGLERLAFPRSSVFCTEYDFQWPPELFHLCLSGGISNDFLSATRFPHTITQFIITHCPFITTESLQCLLMRLGTHITTLKVLYPMPALRHNALDSVLRLCPKLKSLSVSVDYISRNLFEPLNMPSDEHTREPTSHPLQALYLDSSGMLGQAHKVEADDVSLAILEHQLPRLQKVTVSFKLGWNPEKEDMLELADLLEERGGGVWIA